MSIRCLRLLRFLLLPIGLAFLICASAACRRQAPSQSESAADVSTVPVVAAPAQTGAIRTVVRAAGVVTAPADAEFLAVTQEPATILELPRMEGESVATGDLLVRLDIPTATQNVVRQQAEVARFQAAVENARVTHARTRDLVERGLLPRLDLESADREVAEAQAAVDRAEAARVAAQAAAGRAQIRAPFPGIVARRFHNPGDVLQGLASDPILRFIDSSRLEISVSVSAEDAGRVAQGATARLAAIADAPQVRLTVMLREPAPRPGGDVAFRLAFAEPTTLTVDTPVQVDIDAEERANAVFVPADAVVREGTTAFVYVASDGTARKRAVTTGLEDETRVEITQGVAAGEMVLTQGHIGLVDGVAITVGTTAP